MTRQAVAALPCAKLADPCSEQAPSALPAGFDMTAWVLRACEASGVPFALEDPVALAKLRNLVKHPG